jgi:basic membrane lipoprotein Med (substrate-binding protein (PBP1-ABC) superfamily)
MLTTGVVIAGREFQQGSSSEPVMHPSSTGTPAWIQVNPEGFGNANNYIVTALESFSGDLYAGTWNDETGSELWRLSAGALWEQVDSGGFGYSHNNGIDDMVEYKGLFYASTASYSNGGEVWRSPDGLAWSRVVTAGFDDPANAEIGEMAVFSATLYAATGDPSSGVEVWRTTNGVNWARNNSDGFGNPNNIGAVFETFDNQLYAGTWNNTEGAEIWSSDGITWTAVMTGGFGSADNKVIASMAAFNMQLYAVTRNIPNGSEVWRSSDGSEWTQVASGGLGDPNNNRGYGLKVFQEHLYLVTGNLVSGAEVWRTADGTTWEQVGFDGWGDPLNVGSYWDNSIAIFKDRLFVGTIKNWMVDPSGGEIWAFPVAVGFVPDDSGVTDMGWNWLAYQGLLRAKSELGVVSSVYTPTSSTDYAAKLQQCVDEGNDLCISVGFLLASATSNVANANPGTSFAIVDASYESYPENLRGMLFAGEESGYLAGTLAGLMTQSDVIGTVGGMEIPPVIVWIDGYRNGAQCANPAVDVLIDYTGTFGDYPLGAQTAQDMISQGADAIFGVGGLTGFGAVITATQSDVWGIGVDTDFYLNVFENGAVEGSDKLLTSAMKRFDNAVFATVSDVISGTFTFGEVFYDLAQDGVGLAPFHEADPWVPQTVRDALDDVTQGIIDGSIAVSDPCRAHIYLPVVTR